MSDEEENTVEDLMWEDVTVTADVLYARARAYVVAWEETEGRGHDCPELAHTGHMLAHAASRHMDAIDRAVAIHGEQ